MAWQLYEWMTPQQAGAALEEFLAERDRAYEHLRAEMAAGGIGQVALLDSTLDSVAAVWEWITDRCAELGTDPRTVDEDPTRPGWPSWARYGIIVDPHPPAEAMKLVDGFVSYASRVVLAAVPAAIWELGHHRLSDYPMLNRPVLAAAQHQVFLPALPLYSVYQRAHGRDPMSGTEMLGYVRRTISALRGEGPEAATADEPLATVVAEVDCYDVGLRADIAEEHPELVDRLVTELADREGVESVHRYGSAALVVNVPSWDELRLQMWLTLWLQRNLPR